MFIYQSAMSCSFSNTEILYFVIQKLFENKFPSLMALSGDIEVFCIVASFVFF